MDPLALTAEDLAKPDEELGKWLVSRWLVHQARKRGIPIDNIPEDWAASIIEASAGMDSENVENAALESMFRKACSGDFAAAGRMLRVYVHKGAETVVKDKYAGKAIRQAVGSRKGGDRSKQTRSGPTSKRAKIEKALDEYRGAEGARVATVARKTQSTPQYVRKVIEALAAGDDPPKETGN